VNALDLIRARGAAAQICVLRDGEVVLDHAVGCCRDDLFWIFSASKPLIALLVHLLAQRGSCRSTTAWRALARVRPARQGGDHGPAGVATPVRGVGGARLWARHMPIRGRGPAAVQRRRDRPVPAAADPLVAGVPAGRPGR